MLKRNDRIRQLNLVKRIAAAQAAVGDDLELIPVATLDEALAAVSVQPFDLVVLDVDMPGMNGYEVCTKLRALPAYKETPVIFVTSLSDFQSRARSTLSGANDLIAKPFVFVELSVKALSYLLKAELAKPRKA